jgi:hypothetical protein
MVVREFDVRASAAELVRQIGLHARARQDGERET